LLLGIGGEKGTGYFSGFFDGCYGGPVAKEREK